MCGLVYEGNLYFLEACGECISKKHLGNCILQTRKQSFEYEWYYEETPGGLTSPLCRALQAMVMPSTATHVTPNTVRLQIHPAC